MGHNNIDYEGGINKTLSYTFENKIQSKFILDACFGWGLLKNKFIKNV
ncbi:hypothetical protein [Flavobacterium soyae]|nr:hypothetical protein [Flavobacterium soyae]MCD9576500.1 hypothetical protein [Flavobacterium soyae]